MKGNGNERQSCSVRMELKYCEHCGGLWVREPGSGVVYCDKCAPKVADLPAARKKTARVPKLPVRPRTMVEEYELDRFEDGADLEAVGGVA
jgi:ribosomal protein L37AE/L43A